MTVATLTELRRIMRFGVVGASVTIVHLCIAVSLVTWAGWSGHRANLMAFIVAGSLSFAGHYSWSFKSKRPIRQVFARYFLVSVASFTVSVPAITFFSMLFSQQAIVVALGSLVMPTVSYIANRFFVFR